MGKGISLRIGKFLVQVPLILGMNYITRYDFCVLDSWAEDSHDNFLLDPVLV